MRSDPFKRGAGGDPSMMSDPVTQRICATQYASSAMTSTSNPHHNFLLRLIPAPFVILNAG